MGVRPHSLALSSSRPDLVPQSWRVWRNPSGKNEITITFAEVLTLLLVFPIKRRFDMGMRSRFNLQNQADTAHPDPA